MQPKIFILTLLTFLSTMLYAQNTNSPSVWTILEDNEKQLELKSIDIEVKTMGAIAITRISGEIYNPNSRMMEVELKFPLADGQNITGFAIDIEGNMRDAVAVDKSKAREVFENISRRKVDPGLIEKLQGNIFRTRIYPVFGSDTRKFRIEYQEDLSLNKDKFFYRFPFAYWGTAQNISMTIEVMDSETKPHFIHQSKLSAFSKNNETDTWTSEMKTNTFSKNEEVVFSIPYTQSTLVEENEDNVYFTTKIKPQTFKEQPANIEQLAIFWDNSLSMLHRDKDKEFEFLEAFFAQNKNIKVDLYTFNIFSNKTLSYTIQNGDWTTLKSTLESMNPDGGTQLGELSLNEVQADRIFIFSDMMSNFGDHELKKSKVRIDVFQSTPIFEHSVGSSLSASTGGVFINLLADDIELANKQINSENYRLIDIEYSPNDIQDLTLGNSYNLTKGISLSGRLTKPTAQIKLKYGIANKVLDSQSITINKAQHKNYDGLVERFWAQKRIDELDVYYDHNKVEIEKLGQKYNIVTRNTTLLVLETLQDYIRYEITPPANSKIYDRYMEQTKRQRDQTKNNEDRIKSQKIEKLLPLLNSRKDWWKTDFNPEFYKWKDYSYDINSEEDIQSLLSKIDVDIYVAQKINTYYNNPIKYRKHLRPLSDSLLVAPPPPPLRGSTLSEGYTPRPYVAIDKVDLLPLLDKYKKQLEALEMKNSELEHKILMRFNPEEFDTDQISVADIIGSDDAYGIDIADLHDHAMCIEEIDKSRRMPKLEDENKEVKTSTITLKKWTSGESYLDSLLMKPNNELYDSYLRLKADYIEIPGFYFDVADLFQERGLKKEALIILSNLAELQIDNYKVLKVLGHRLQQLGYHDLAIRQFRKVLTLRDEEPQSYRDLGLALAENAEYQEALVELYQVIIKRHWNDRFGPIEVVATEEINNVLFKAKQNGYTIDSSLIDPRLLIDMPLDVRIVLNWDTDNSDMDLYVSEPSGDMASYWHEKTRIGGLLPFDARGGYGPEEYLLKKGYPGKYTIKVNYFGNSEQTLVGSTTIYLDIFTNYSKPNEEKQTIMFRLSKNSGEETIGEINIE